LPPQTIPRIVGAQEGHYTEWVEACTKGYGNMKLSSSFDYAGPFTEAVLMGNLAIRSYNQRKMNADGKGYSFPGRKKLLWDAKNMKITNFEAANAFVKSEYRSGWSL
jgi:hypothetical protein